MCGGWAPCSATGGRECYTIGGVGLAQQRKYREAAALATAGVAEVVYRIRRLGLVVALNKPRRLYIFMFLERAHHQMPTSSSVASVLPSRGE